MAFDIRLKENFKIFISGPSGCGKTTFVSNLLINIQEYTKFPPSQIVYYFKEWQPKFDQMQKDFDITFIEDNDLLLDQLKEIDGSAFIIFDDMMNSSNLKLVAQLFAVHGRHMNLSLAFISQRLFQNSEHFRQISQNSDYFCVFKNPRNSMEIRSLAMQITPKTLELLDIFTSATRKPYSYLFIDLTQECIPQLKYKTDLFTEKHIAKTFIVTSCK